MLRQSTSHILVGHALQSSVNQVCVKLDLKTVFKKVRNVSMDAQAFLKLTAHIMHVRGTSMIWEQIVPAARLSIPHQAPYAQPKVC